MQHRHQHLLCCPSTIPCTWPSRWRPSTSSAGGRFIFRRRPRLPSGGVQRLRRRHQDPRLPVRRVSSRWRAGSLTGSRKSPTKARHRSTRRGTTDAQAGAAAAPAGLDRRPAATRPPERAARRGDAWLINPHAEPADALPLADGAAPQYARVRAAARSRATPRFLGAREFRNRRATRRAALDESQPVPRSRSIKCLCGLGPRQADGRRRRASRCRSTTFARPETASSSAARRRSAVHDIERHAHARCASLYLPRAVAWRVPGGCDRPDRAAGMVRAEGME